MHGEGAAACPPLSHGSATDLCGCISCYCNDVSCVVFVTDVAVSLLRAAGNQLLSVVNMASFESIELYDPESPSDDLCQELNQSGTWQDSIAQGGFESASEKENAETRKISATKGSVASGTEVNSISTAERSSAANTEHLPFKNVDSSVVEPPSIDKNEQSRLSRVPAPAVHQLPPVVQLCRHAVPLRRGNSLLSVGLTAASGTGQSTSSQSSQATHDEEQCLSGGAATDEHVKLVDTSKPAVEQSSVEKVLDLPLEELNDDVEAAEDSAAKKISSDVNLPDTDSDIHMLDASDVQQLQNIQQSQQQCADSDNETNDSLNSGECNHGLCTENSVDFSSVSEGGEKVCESNEKHEHTDVGTESEKIMNDTSEKMHASDSVNVLNHSHTNEIDDIEEPAEPCDTNQMPTFSEQPRIIKLTRTEDLSEPDEFLQTAVKNNIREQLQCCDSDNVESDGPKSAESDYLNTANSLSMFSVLKALEKVFEGFENHEGNDVEISDDKFMNDASQKACNSDPGSMLNDSLTNSMVDIADPKAMEKVCENSGNHEQADFENDNEKCMDVTSEKTHSSDPDSLLNGSSMNGIDDIAEPAEPCDADQTMTFSEQPRIIQLTRIVEDPAEPDEVLPTSSSNSKDATCSQIIEDPSEPDEMLQTSDKNGNGEHVTFPRIIRLDRESDVKEYSRPIAQPCEISEPSEPSDTEADDDLRQFVPREIRLDREELVSGSLTKSHVIQRNALLAKSHVVAETNAGVDSLEDRMAAETMYCRDMPLSPAGSIESASGSDCDDRHLDTYCNIMPLSRAGSVESVNDSDDDYRHSDISCSSLLVSPLGSTKSVIDSNHDERHSSKHFIVLEDCSYDGMSDVGNSSSSSRGSSRSMKSNRSALYGQYLSEGEIVDEEEDEEFGIFQVPKCAKLESHDSKHQKKSGKRKSSDDDDDLDTQCHDRSENRVDHSRSVKQHKMSTDAPRPASSRSSSVTELDDESVDVPVQQLLYETSKLPVGRRQVTRKDEGKRSSVSPDKLLVGAPHSTKRKVVIISSAADESRERKCSDYPLAPVKDAHKTSRSVRDSRCDMPEPEKKVSNKRKQTVSTVSKRHHKHRTRRNEPQAHKHKWKHKKRKRRKHRPDDDDDDFEKRHSRSRARSYNRIVEMIRCEEQMQSSNARHIPSFVVHRNTLVSARPRSSSVSSVDSRPSFDNSAPTPVLPNSDHSRNRNVSGDHTGMHLSRLSYTGEAEQDVSNTLLGECIRSKYGPEYDVNCISRNLAYTCFDAADEVEIVGVSYSGDRQPRNDNLHNVALAQSSGRNVDDRDYERVQVTISSDQQPQRSVDRSAATAKEPVIANHRPRNDVGTNKTGAKKVTMVSAEVQTQESLFTETRNHAVESIVLSGSTSVNPGHGKVDKELQVTPDLDNEQDCIHSPSSPVSVGCNTDTVTGIQSPEHRTEETSHIPRPVLLDIADAQQPTMPNSQDFSDLYFTVRNFSKPLMSRARNMSLERGDKSVDAILPPVTTSGASITLSSITLDNGAKQLPRSVASGMEVSSISTAGRSSAAYTEHLPSKNVDSGAVNPPSIDSAARKNELNRLSNVPAPAVHQLPQVVQPYKHAVPLRRVNPLLSDRLTAASGAVHLPPSTSTVQTVQKKPVAAVKSFIPSRPTSTYKSLSGAGQDDMAVIAGLSSRENQNIRSSPELLESRSFLSSADRIPGICEDVEPDIDSRTGGRPSPLSAYQGSANGLGVINGMTTSAAATASVSPQRHITAAGDTVVPPVGTSAYWAPDALGLSSGNASASMNAAAAAGAGSSVDMEPVAACLLPLLSTLTTCLLQTPLQQPVPASSVTNISTVPTNSNAPAANSRNSVPPLNHVNTSVSSTDDAVCAWITSLPPSSSALEPQPTMQPLSLPLPSPCPVPGRDFDVDAVESPCSDEISSFSPPSSEYMMSVIKMKHTLGLKNKAAGKTTNGFKQPKLPSKTGMTVSLKIL